MVDGGYYESGNYYFYINDHLGNNRIVTDAAAAVVQSTQYYPFGASFAEGTTTEQGKQPYKYNGKELDMMHGLNMYDYSARYYESTIGRFTTIDPLAEKYYSWSPYAYCANNPILMIDPTGKDWIIVSHDGKELRRVEEKGADTYYKVNETAFNAASSYYSKELGATDNFNNTLLSVGGLMLLQEKGVEGLVAQQTGVGINVTGSMRDGSSLIGDVTVNVQATFDDGRAYNIGTYSGVAGGYGNGAPENGDYSVNNYQDRSPRGWYNSGMNKDGVGFSYNLNPEFNTGRTALRIHPDGNNEGTLGCIGLSGNKNHLKSFVKSVNNSLLRYQSISLNINIKNNPNNNGRNKTKIPNVRE